MNSSESHIRKPAHHTERAVLLRGHQAANQPIAAHGTNVREITTRRSARHTSVLLGSHQRAHRAAGHLVERMYARRGLSISAHRDDTLDHNRLVITAGSDEQVFGTMTLGFDHAEGLLAEARYAEEITSLRARGARICEITRLAIDSRTGSKEILAALFQLGHIHSRQIRRMTDAVIEVHPRHAPFYARMLGFSRIGEETICPRVNAPAVLMHIDLAHADAMIARHAGFREAGEKSLYPYFLPAEEQPQLLAHCG
ncbi:N-acyl amino acid synthase FeeM domain-containing protein [Cognatazoarcus halotolerans]|uniref:N-acyl amino acid synthase FeeM domain-containing protein n=1 Tax=Cognatazoarcus halotolerans TaxID=2686016 RepID=UPI001358753A|nr:hypothetical protein [Cognatazoarcus halotolerans]MBX3678985.1 long-chain N-acyl amino acid synthase [Rhodocyclaceae bacterium]MCB1898900.1 long-chain N-acyl amino acid synthase [Rhodocyclaceae bacterium]MCP5309119.1 hypothetical protein [Zoogloeaceae bacterium]